jgi:hypothetical protein
VGEHVDLVMIQQPGRVGVGVVAGHQILGEARGELGRGHLLRVDGSHQYEDGLRPRDLLVGQPEHEEIEARPAPHGLLPALSHLLPLRQRGMRGSQGRQVGVGLLDRPVAGEERDALRRSRQTLVSDFQAGVSFRG